MFVPKYMYDSFEYLLFALVSGGQGRMVANVVNWKIHVPWDGDSLTRCLGSYHELETQSAGVKL